jgi:hypothetical protein
VNPRDLGDNGVVGTSQMFIHYGDGSSQEGAILSLRGGTMRVAVAGLDDVCEFELRSGAWVSECLEVVSFSFPAGDGRTVHLARAAENPPQIPSSPHRTRRAIQ